MRYEKWYRIDKVAHQANRRKLPTAVVPYGCDAATLIGIAKTTLANAGYTDQMMAQFVAEATSNVVVKSRALSDPKTAYLRALAAVVSRCQVRRESKLSVEALRRKLAQAKTARCRSRRFGSGREADRQ